LKSFAAQTGISYEGLRKIELGERTPTVETIAVIIRAVDLDDDRAHQLKISRDLAHADRENLLNKGVTDEKIEDVALECRNTLVGFLAEFDMGLEEGDQKDLLLRLIDCITGEFRA